MIFYYFSCVFVIVQAIQTSFPKKFCDLHSDSYTKQCYLKETLVSMPHSPNQLAVDRSSDKLYFSFDTGQGDYIPAVYKLETKKLSVLKGVKDAFAIAYDPVTKEVYFGGSHGIYRYNSTRRELRRLIVPNLDIWWLFVKKKVRFIKFPNLNAYYYANRTVKHIPELRSKILHQFVYDDEENVFFINTTGLYGIKNNTDEPILLRDNPRFIGMSIDNKGNVYVCSDDAIFVISKVVQKVKRLINIQGVLGITFDRNNNIIYSDSHEIVRLISVSNENYYDVLKSISL